MMHKPFFNVLVSLLLNCTSGKVIPQAHAYENTPPAASVTAPFSPKDDVKQSVQEFPPLEIRASPLEKENTLEKRIEGVDILSVDVVSAFDGQKADTKPKYAREGETVWLYAVIKAKTPEGIVYFTEAKDVTIDGRTIQSSQVKQWNYPLDLLLEWYKIEADSNGKWYVRDKGARCPGKSPCRDVVYEEMYAGDGWKIRADAHPTLLDDQFSESDTGLGVMRYKVIAIQGEKETSSLGKEAMQKHAKKVPKVVFRGKTNSFVDYLFELFNTPYIWGSTQDAVDNLIGSDCADLVVYGRRRMGHTQEYTWSGGLPSVTNPVVVINPSSRFSLHYLDKKGRKIPVQAGENSVQPGDILLWNGHAAVFYKDDGDGYLGKSDLMIQTIFSEPSISYLNQGMGSAPREVRRWR